MPDRTEAQRRAQRKYKNKLKQWQVRLQPEVYEAIEAERERQGLSRSELLKKIIKESKN